MRKKAWIIFGLVLIIGGLYGHIVAKNTGTGFYEMYIFLEFVLYIGGGIALIYGLMHSEQQLKEEAEKEKRKREQPVEIKKHHVVIFLISIIVFILGSCSIIKSENSTSRWDRLSDQEKQWYHDNYGNGKSDAYDKAIEDYSN